MSVDHLPAVLAYLEGTGSTSVDEDTVTAALAAETAAQARVCRVPTDDSVWPDDLLESLCRRVARNLALRALPLGFQVNMSEAGLAATRVGADPEIRRLEGPFRKLVLG